MKSGIEKIEYDSDMSQWNFTYIENLRGELVNERKMQRN